MEVVRVSDIGATNAKGRGAGENVAYNTYGTAQSFMRQWLRSPAYRATILSPIYKRIGVAVRANCSGRPLPLRRAVFFTLAYEKTAGPLVVRIAALTTHRPRSRFAYRLTTFLRSNLRENAPNLQGKESGMRCCRSRSPPPRRCRPSSSLSRDFSPLKGGLGHG
jgi:hypothetical protein